MMRKLLFSVVTLAALAAVGFAGLIAEPKAADQRAKLVVGPNTPTPTASATSFSNARWDYDYDYWLLGTTFYDYQHNGTENKQICIGDEGTVHFAWMKAFDAGATERHVVYACWQGDDILGGNSVDNTGRSGYNTIDVLDADGFYPNAAVVAFHQMPGTDFVTALAPDYGPCWQAFLPFNHPSVDEWGSDDQPIWPHIAIDYNNKAHVLSTRANDNNHYYDATSDFSTWEAPAWVDPPSFNNSISSMPATSEFDGRAALLCHNFIEGVHPDPSGLIFSQSINDVWVYLTDDGEFGDCSNYINVTNLLDEEATNHPLPGCVYSYCDLDGVYDADGNLHVVYTTRPYWAEVTLLDGEVADPEYFERWGWDGQIWHALVDAEGEVVEFSHIAGYVGENNEDPADWSHYFEGNPGAWGSTYDRPSLSIDPADGTLYCMYRNFTNLPDTSAGAFSNADLYVVSSCDGGASWGHAVNVTNSQTPACAAGDCASEAWGTMAEVVADGLLHMEFVEDLDAGGIPQEEGSWTDSPVWYMQVPVEEIPCGDAWDEEPRATRLTDTAWNWAALEDDTYEIVDFMRVLNESRSTVNLESIEILYIGEQPEITITQVNGTLGDAIAPYTYAEYTYTWTCNIADANYDAWVRFNTDGGTCDFTLANRNDLDEGSAESFIYFVEDVKDNTSALPTSIELSQNYPNPFNPATSIEYTLTTPQQVSLEVFNILGQPVATLASGHRTTGTHTVNFNAGELTSGVYFYRLTAGDQMITRKMVLAK